jgi:hypothetical protein
VHAREKRYLDITQRHLIDTKSEFNLTEATKEISQIFVRRWTYLIQDFKAEHEAVNESDIPSEKELLKAIRLEHRLDSMKHEIQQALVERGGVRVDVTIDAGELQEVEQSTLCSVKIVTKIKNYHWTAVEQQGEESPKYILNPE